MYKQLRNRKITLSPNLNSKPSPTPFELLDLLPAELIEDQVPGIDCNLYATGCYVHFEYHGKIMAAKLFLFLNFVKLKLMF